MKKNSIVMILIAALLGVVVFQEVRISNLKKEFVQSESATAPSVATNREKQRNSLQSEASTPRNRELSSRKEPKKNDSETENPLEGFGKAMRKMADNPAAKAMFAQAHVSTAEQIYASLLDDLDLNEEEHKYFVSLLAGEFADQQQMGMKMMAANTPEDRKALAAEMEANKEAREKLIAEFLNHEEDNEAYQAYHERLPEHQQLPGIKAAIASTGNELRPDQENALVDAMHKVRTSGDAAERWEGVNAMDTMAQDNVVEIFEKDWADGQAAYQQKLGPVLDPDQLKAFADSQAQMKEMHLMGIKMMQNMMKARE